MTEEKKFLEHWFMQLSKNINFGGEIISKNQGSFSDWFEVKIPTTVFNGLVENNVITEPYFGTNLKESIGYKIDVKTQNLESHYKPQDSPYRVSWWFRKEFILDEIDKGRQFWLKIDGLNYSANLWLNGKRVAGSDYLVGTYRRYDLNVTHFVVKGVNVIAFEIFSPNPDDLSISFVDWSPLPPDDNMGIWQPITLYSTGSIAIKNSFVTSKISDNQKEADLTIVTELHNFSNETIEGTLKTDLGFIMVEKDYMIDPNEFKIVKLTSNEFKQLKIINPKLWWPYQLGNPYLYKINLSFYINEELADQERFQFGIKEFTSYINEHGTRIFKINRKDIIIRGAGWTCDMMLNQSRHQDEIDINFIKNLNFNAIRFEGKLATDDFWDLCDRHGILVLAGWVCCSHWEKWNDWKKGDLRVAEESLRSQIIRLRNHPSLLAWFYGSDFPPPREVEKTYLRVFNETFNDLITISSATAKPTDLKGETGVKMTGPYSYVPPIYWYDMNRRGYASGFNTETGPDVCIPPLDSLIKMIPKEQLDVGSDAWNFHAGLGSFKNTNLVEDAVTKRYGKFKNLEDFVNTSQLLGYECWRAMYEAHRHNYPKASGVIGWMLNSPWPSLIWQLYDYYNNTNGAYFGSKKGCEPIHIQLSYEDYSIWCFNNTLKNVENLIAIVKLYDSSLNMIFSEEKQVSLEKYGKTRVTTLKKLDNSIPVYFLSLTLLQRSELVSSNFYWLSSKRDIFYEKDEWFYTPLKEHADLSELRNLPQTKIDFEYCFERSDIDQTIKIQIKNQSKILGLFIRIDLINNKENDVISPVYWNDNCISMIPGEEREILGKFSLNIDENIISIRVKGWNC